MDEGVWYSDNKVYFDDDHCINRGTWGVICAQRNVSKFVTKLAYALVGFDILSECMTGDEKTGKKRRQRIES